MGLPSFTRVVDLMDNVEAININVLYDEVEAIATSSPLANYANVETLSAAKTLTNADAPIQSLNPNGANRDVNLPAAGSANHAFFFWNRAAATYSLVVKNSGGTTIVTVGPASGAFVFADGASGWIAVSGGATVADASETVKGIVELATAAEINTGTDATRAISPDALAGANIGRRVVQATVVDYATDLATGDGKWYFLVPPELNGMNLVGVHVRVITAGTTNTSDFQLANVTDAVDMLSTKATIDSTETGTDTAATPAVIDTTKDDVATYDLLRLDVDAISTTKPKGLIVTLEFGLP
jgi:hypothetical protein